MLDRKAFDEEMREARKNQLREIENSLNQFSEWTDGIREFPPYTQIKDEDINELNSISIQTKGRDPRDIATELQKLVFNPSIGLNNPRCFAFVTTAVSPYSVAGAFLTDIFNPNLAGYQLCPGGKIIEEKLIQWMGSLAGFDDNCGGLFTSGGSISSLTGMIAARLNVLKEDELPIAVAYTSDQAHSSIRKGMKLLGLRKDQIKIIPSDDSFKIKIDLLEQEIESDVKAGKKPFLIVGNLGSTNTGSIDPLPELAAIKEKYGMWLHVDGAYGGSILLSDIYRNLAKGLGRADSFTWDLHKWALQTYSCSALIAKDKKKLINAYAEHPEYLADIIDSEHTDGWDLGIEMSRPARAIKFWYTVQAMGTDKIADIIDYAFYNSHVAEKKFKEMEGWEICSAPMCGAINFRYAPKDVDPSKYDELNNEISEELIKSQFAYIVTTVIKNQRVLRMCMINGNTTTEDVTDTIEKLNEIALELKLKYSR